MSKEVKSQWEFGDLFSQPTTRRILTVTQLTANVRSLLEKQLGQVWVSGELSNVKAQSSGHIYFTLKDANAQLTCVLFRGELLANRDLLTDGQKVVLHGALTVYEQRGQYQLRVLAVELQGVGALQQAFERLKQRLHAEGLFATERKRPIPRHPKNVGLVTSETGAAIRDVLHVVQRRNPGLRIMLAACRVQGPGAGEEVARAICLLNEWAGSGGPERCLDVILVTRGGGSLEDLWAFNEEIVARAIFHSRIAVISAVGHEIDFTISDFVADLRAATPSAAAEIVTEGAVASRRVVSERAQYLRLLVRRQIDQHREEIAGSSQRLLRLHPRRQLNEKLQYLDDLRSTLVRCTGQTMRHYLTKAQNLQFRFLRFKPSLIMAERKHQIVELYRSLRESATHSIERRRNLVDHLRSRLRLLSPENVLARGYSITMDATSGRVIRNANQVRPKQRLRTRLAKGEIQSDVTPGTNSK
ncbi:MAG TPA: exodeoxyribonuclease VII large subunit [Verrucomicrobiae bacterium]|nr:exodeoxyribonuclease VII large subunit [Verrucomicrobiae bacterium]